MVRLDTRSRSLRPHTKFSPLMSSERSQKREIGVRTYILKARQWKWVEMGETAGLNSQDVDADRDKDPRKEYGRQVN